MKRRCLQQVLHHVLLLGAPWALTDCFLAQSSCPDNGAEPPQARVVTVQASLADGGPLTAEECQSVCADPNTNADVTTCVREELEMVLCVVPAMPCEGRRPPGLKRARRTAGGAFEQHLADAAWLEAASIEAFGVLRRELRAHGAPRRLLRAASRSARDERRHARVSRALAGRFGVAVTPVERAASAPRSLEAIALENAVEGCVRETWGALMASRQAERATEPALRAAMVRIARDEARHAELAWAIQRWLRPRLSGEQRARVRQARTAAVAELSAELSVPLPLADRLRLGLPGPDEAARLLAELDDSLGLTTAV